METRGGTSAQKNLSVVAYKKNSMASTKNTRNKISPSTVAEESPLIAIPRNTRDRTKTITHAKSEDSVELEDPFALGDPLVLEDFPVPEDSHVLEDSLILSPFSWERNLACNLIRGRF